MGRLLMTACLADMHTASKQECLCTLSPDAATSSHTVLAGDAVKHTGGNWLDCRGDPYTVGN